MSIGTNLAKRFAVNDSGEAATTRAQAWSRGVQKHNWRVLTAGENNFVVSTDRKSKAWSSAVFMQLSMRVYVCVCVMCVHIVCLCVHLCRSGLADQPPRAHFAAAATHSHVK